MSSNNCWINKLKIECIEREDGGLDIQIDWDETDPDLELWTSWGDEGQTAFIIDSLRQATECYHDE